MQRRRSGEKLLRTHLRTQCCEGLDRGWGRLWAEARGVSTEILISGLVRCCWGDRGAQTDGGGVCAMLEGDYVDRG